MGCNSGFMKRKVALMNTKIAKIGATTDFNSKSNQQGVVIPQGLAAKARRARGIEIMKTRKRKNFTIIYIHTTGFQSLYVDSASCFVASVPSYDVTCMMAQGHCF